MLAENAPYVIRLRRVDAECQESPLKARMLVRLLPMLLAAIGSGASAEETELPQRKAGLWELSTIMDDGSGRRDQVLTMCVDAEMERNTVRSSAAEHRANCESYDVKRSGDSIVVEAECSMSKANVNSRTEMRGDFHTSFKVHIESSTWRPAESGEQTRVVKRTIDQTGRYVSTSCGDLKGGEAMGTDGNRILVQ